MTTNNTNGTYTQGWTPSSDGRGTYDILVSCLVTTFLCCWTSVYPNVAAPTAGRWERLVDKLRLTCLAILGPEFIITLAMGQKSSARRSVNKFHAEGYFEWTATHAFFADMGGFVLDADGLEQPIPLDAEQVFYLVKHGYIKYPGVSKKELDDRDKSDGLSRVISIFQAIWFILNLIARVIQHLTITTLELTTVSFVIILFGTAWCWKDKPSDVIASIHLKASVSIADIIMEGGRNTTESYYHTPLDFVSRYESPLNVLYQYYKDLLRRVLFVPLWKSVRAPPRDHIPSDIFLPLEFDLAFVCAGFILAFSCVFSVAWNAYFASTFERDFWRAASIYMIVFGTAGLTLHGLWMFVIPRETNHELSLFEKSLLDSSRHRWYTRYVGRSKDPSSITRERSWQATPKRTWCWLFRSHNISRDKDPRLSVTVSFLLPNMLLCMFYCIFRLYILLEDIAALRSLPSDAYATVNWLSFIPHI